jgi:diguanylate cyclase (GGDEF)-like protein/PAS domain S-box-containing protein
MADSTTALGDPLGAMIGLLAADFPGIAFQRRMSPDGCISYPFFSPGVVRVLGITPSAIKLSRDGVLEFIHWADRSSHMNAILNSAERLSACTEAFRAISRDGRVIWLEGSSLPRMGPDGTVVWDGILIDVTERVQAEAQLELIMDHAADCIITIDEMGIIETVNATTAKVFGWPETELIGRNVKILMPEPFASAHDGHLARFRETGEGDFLGKGPRELTALRKDGSTFPFELAISEVKSEGRRIFIGVGRDVTSRLATETALRETEERLTGIAANMPGIVFRRVRHADGTTRYAYISEAARSLLGVDPQDIMNGKIRFRDILTPEFANRSDILLDRLQKAGDDLSPVDIELCFKTPAGEERWLRSLARPRLMDNGDVIWDGVALDITVQKKAEKHLQFLAFHDPLTGVANRASFLLQIENAIEHAKTSGEKLNILSIGIDGFSFINTTLGHYVGDIVLRAIAKRLEGLVGSAALVARIGGDRFLVLLRGPSGARQVSDGVERIWRSLREPLSAEGQDFELAASIGVSVFPSNGEEPEALIRNADAALAQAKAQGSGNIRVFTHELSEKASRTFSMQSRIRRAIEHQEFTAHYQPQVDLSTGRIVAFEALVRWFTPEGPIPPSDFIPVAEEFGLIDPISDVVLNATARHLKSWRDKGLTIVPVAVNISGRQFLNPRRLIATLEQVTQEYGIEPSLIEIELTESSAMHDPATAITTIQQLKERGIRCAIDDFGTGYSSLGILKRFPIQKLKVDRSFVTDIDHDLNDAAIVQAIIAMAHALKLKVVAEGVETESHLAFLKNLGCDQMQGYFFSRPVPETDIERMLAEGKRLALPA